jgi:hypothetical protein
MDTQHYGRSPFAGVTTALAAGRSAGHRIDPNPRCDCRRPPRPGAAMVRPLRAGQLVAAPPGRK